MFEQSVDINENDLNEHCGNSFISEENKVLDWTVEVQNDKLEEEEEDDDDNDDDDDEEDEDDDANKVIYSHYLVP